MRLFLIVMLFSFHSICFANQIIIDKPTSYKNVVLDLSQSHFLIVNNASLKIENCIINGSISVNNPLLINVMNGSLLLKNNSFNISSIDISPNPSNSSIYSVIQVTEGQINIIANNFIVNKSYTVGLLVTGKAHTSNFNITDNTIYNFHGGLLLRNSSDTTIINNTFKNVSFGNIFVINGYNNLIKGNVILFSGNNNVGDAIDVISSDKLTLSANYILAGSCYGIVILNSKNILLDHNRIMGGITYAISTDQYDAHLKHFLAKENINIDENNHNIMIINNYLAQNRYGLKASNIDGLIVKGNVFIQRFSNKAQRKFWTDNHTLFKNVSHLTWMNNIYKEAFSQEDKLSNEKSLQFFEFPLFGGVDL